MIADEKKKQIESLPIEEMLYEINLGRRSRFQREKYAYLQTCYQQKIDKGKLKNFTSKNQSCDKSANIINEKQQPKEPRLVWFAWSVAVVIFAALVVWAINHYFNLGL